MSKNEIIILSIGFIGQSLFFMRFFIQWLYAEKHGKSLIPIAFWYFSIGGSSIILLYSILRKDIVFIAGQSMGLLIYSRNLYFIYRERQKDVIPLN